MGEILLGLLQSIKLALHALGGSSCSQVAGVVFANMTTLTSADPHGLPVAATTVPNDG
jgi:hypothetical protein